MRARIFRAVDRWNYARAPLIYTDTAAHREALQTVIGPAAAIRPSSRVSMWVVAANRSSGR